MLCSNPIPNSKNNNAIMKKMIPRKSAVLSFLSRRLKPIIHIGTHSIRKNNASFLRIFLGIKSLIGLRVSEEEEIIGLDIGEHDMESYAGFQIFTVE